MYNTSVNRNIRLLSLFNFFTDFVFFAPVAIIYYSKVTGSAALGMSIFSIAYVSSALFEIPTGILSDLVGRKRTMILGSVFSVLCVVFLAIGGTYWVLVIGALFNGISRSFFSGNNDALLHDTLKHAGKESEYNAYYGRIASMSQFALAFASVVGGFMAAQSYALVMWVSVIPQVITLIISLRIDEPRIYTTRVSTNALAHLKEAAHQYRQNTKLLYITAANVLRFALGESLYFIRNIFIVSLWPLWAVGFSGLIGHLSGAIGFFYSGRIVKKYGYHKTLIFEVLFNRVVSLIAYIFPNITSPILLSGTTLGYGIGMASINALQQKEFTQEQRATMGSVNSLASNVVFGVTSITLGCAVDVWGIIPVLIITQFIFLAPLWFYKKAFAINYSFDP